MNTELAGSIGIVEKEHQQETLLDAIGHNP